MSDFIQIVCPNCGAPIPNADPLAISYKCPYCGAEFFNPNVKENIREAYVFPVNIDEQAFRENVKNILVSEEDLPLDFIDSRLLFTSEAKLCYFPFYVFWGITHSSWNCDFVTEVERERTNYNGQKQTYFEKRYTPGNGISTENYEMLFDGMADKDNKIARFFSNHNSDLIHSLSNAHLMTEGSLKGIVMPAVDMQTLWRDEVEGRLTAQGDFACRNQASNHAGKISGFSSTTSIERQDEKLYYLPVYVLEVNYKNEVYYFIQDASNAFTETCLPKDQEYIDKKRSVKAERDRNIKSNPSNIFGPVAFLIGYGAFALFNAKMLWEVIGGCVLWLIVLCIEESRYRHSHILPAIIFFALFAVFQFIDVRHGFWGFTCHFIIPLVASEIPALSYYNRESEINEANNSMVRDKFNKTMKALTDDRADKRRIRVNNL